MEGIAIIMRFLSSGISSRSKWSKGRFSHLSDLGRGTSDPRPTAEVRAGPAPGDGGVRCLEGQEGVELHGRSVLPSPSYTAGSWAVHKPALFAPLLQQFAPPPREITTAPSRRIRHRCLRSMRCCRPIFRCRRTGPWLHLHKTHKKTDYHQVWKSNQKSQRHLSLP